MVLFYQHVAGEEVSLKLFHFLRLSVLGLFFSVLSAGFVSAGPLVLNCPGGMSDQSGNPAITFGGAGIPKDAVCIGSFDGNLTLALTATPRFANPSLTNNGVDTYYAQTGDDSAQGQPNYGPWNFNFYAYNASQTDDYWIDLMWDTDPSFGTDTSLFGFGRSLLVAGSTVQNSWNLGMGFIDTGVVVPGYSPSAVLFSPYANGQYSFSLRGYKGSILEDVGGVAMNVEAVPEPASMMLLGTGLVGLAAKVRRRKKEK